jgi:tetratricopeptide (TPR) repeat protein
MTTLSLPVLLPDESRRVVQASCQTVPLPDPVVQEILCRAEGNPFFLEELIRAVSHDGMGQTRLGMVPDTIQGVLMARIDRLPDATRWCLQTAAVLGREAHNWLLTAVWSGPGNLEAHLQALQRLEFLHVYTEAGEPVYRFTHALTQEVAYESVPLPRRQVLHTAIGRVLEAFYADRLEAVADRLAYHYTRGVEAQKAVTFLTLCAEKAVRTHAHAEAATACEEALAQVTCLPETERERLYLDLALRQAFSWAFLGRFRETLERLLPQQMVLERLADPVLAGRYYFRLALTYWMLGEHEHAGQSAQRARADAHRGHDVATLGKASYVLALVAHASGQFHQAIADGQQAVALLEQTEEWHYLGLTHFILGGIYGRLGDFTPALEALARVTTIGAATDDPRLQSLAAWTTGWILVLRGEWDAGIAGLQRGLDLATDPASRAFAATYLGFAYVESDQAARAIPLLQQVVEQFQRFRYLQGQGQATTWLGEAWLLNGDLATARVLAQQVGLDWHNASSGASPTRVGRWPRPSTTTPTPWRLLRRYRRSMN